MGALVVHLYVGLALFVLIGCTLVTVTVLVAVLRYFVLLNRKRKWLKPVRPDLTP